MNKKLIGIFGIVMIFLFTSITYPVIAENDGENTLAENHIIAIGTFAHCDTDEVVYGYILIGFNGLRPFFNTNIEICDDSIQRVTMTNHFLNCVYSCG